MRYSEEAYVFKGLFSDDIYEAVSTPYVSFISTRIDVRTTDQNDPVGVSIMFLEPLTEAARELLKIEPEIRS